MLRTFLLFIENRSNNFFSKCFSVHLLFVLYFPSCGTGESHGSLNRDEHISQVAQDIQKKLPELFDLDVIRKTFGKDISPTSVVLLQELDNWNKLVVCMQQSLAELQRVRIKTRY